MIAWLRKSGFETSRKPIFNALLVPAAIAASLAASSGAAVAAGPDQAASAGQIAGRASSSMPAGSVVDENYRLGGGDRLRIRFFDRYDRDDLNGEYVVGEGGQVRLPRIGVFDARDKTTVELEHEIRRNVESRGEKLGYFSIDIAQCRPFYVTGLANRPGAYPYMPGYTVLHAVSVAGGLYRTPLGSVADSMREKRNLNETMDRLTDLIARRARLEAERSNADAIRMPKELEDLDPARACALIASETDLLQRAREVTKREKAGFEGAIQLANSEIESYRAEIVRTGKRVEEMAAVFDQLKTLHEHRVINQQRLFEATAALDAAQRDKQAAFTGHARARADQEKAQKELALLELSANARTAREIAAADREIARLKAAAAQTRMLASTLDTLSGQGGPGQGVSYRIMRRTKSGELVFEQASETTPIMPGDVIEIQGQTGPGPRDQVASLTR